MVVFLPLTFGIEVTIAGRSMSGKALKMTFDIAIKAPVLPAETIASDLPYLIELIANLMLDLPPFLRAIEGFSSAEI